jgi:hypothetical protein
VLLKTKIMYGKGRWLLFNNQWAGRDKGGSWACLRFPLRDSIPKNSFLGLLNGVSPPSVSASSWQEAADPTYKRNCLSYFFSLGTHLDTRCLNYCSLQWRFLMEIWVVHGDLVHLWRLIALLPYDLDPKGFHSVARGQFTSVHGVVVSL